MPVRDEDRGRADEKGDGRKAESRPVRRLSELACDRPNGLGACWANAINLVGGTRIELVTPTMSR